MPSRSPRKTCARIALIVQSLATSYGGNEMTNPKKTLPAPSGVTRMAGAKEYAAKLATSPRITFESHERRNLKKKKRINY